MSISCMTTLCYLESEHRYLMLHRVKKKNDVNHDKWIGIGGHFEEGESPEECVLRETEEETGLRLTKYQMRGIVTFVADDVKEYMFLFTATEWTGEMHECDEGTLEWVPKNQVAALPIWEGDKVFFRLLDENRPFFSLKLVYHGDQLMETVLDGQRVGPISEISE